MDPIEAKKRILQAADEYHLIAEDQWAQAIDLAPESEDAEFEFRRLIRAALQFYLRALLVVWLVETDEFQQLEDLIEVMGDLEPELTEFLEKNDAVAILDEESGVPLSRVFTVAEALRTLILHRSTQLAATLNNRFFE
jgi:hypothetical protein